MTAWFVYKKKQSKIFSEKIICNTKKSFTHIYSKFLHVTKVLKSEQSSVTCKTAKLSLLIFPSKHSSYLIFALSQTLSSSRPPQVLSHNFPYSETSHKTSIVSYIKYFKDLSYRIQKDFNKLGILVKKEQLFIS